MPRSWLDSRLDPNVLRPITHRSVALQESLTVIRAREVLVRIRTALVNAARGLAKPCGFRLPSCSTKSFHKRCLALLPEGLKPALKPLVDEIERITIQIELFNQDILEMTKTSLPETQALVQVPGVGALTAVTFVLTVGDKNRFKQSRDVGSYLGLRPRRDQSGSRDPQLGITQSRKRLSTKSVGRMCQPHRRTVRQGQRSQTLGTAPYGKRRKECPEKSSGGSGTEACCFAA